MRPSGAALLIALLASAAYARTEPDGSGRTPPALAESADPSFKPVLREIENRMPGLDAAAAAALQVPARAIELGPRAHMYRCWRLRLTGDHGKKVVRVFERLHSVQAALREEKAQLTKDLLLYSEASAPPDDLPERIRARNRSLGSLLDSYNQLLMLGIKGGFLKVTEKSFLSGRRTITPLLKEDDYTMVYDDGAPDCKR